MKTLYDSLLQIKNQGTMRRSISCLISLFCQICKAFDLR